MANYTEALEYKHEVLANGIIQVRTTTVTYKDGERISDSHHRHALAPGDDLSNEANATKAIAAAVWTPEVISAYQTFVAEQMTQKLGGQ